MKKKIYLTNLCVAIAGVFFFLAVIIKKPILAIPGAFFDWLPLPTGWMRMGMKINKVFLILHIVLTLIAYGFLIAWGITGISLLSLIFIEVWWGAVISGVVMTIEGLVKK